MPQNTTNTEATPRAFDAQTPRAFDIQAFLDELVELENESGNSIWQDINRAYGSGVDDIESNRDFPRNPNLKCKELLSDKNGKIVKGNRSFGIELETLTEDSFELRDFAREIHPAFGLVHDGSINPSGRLENGIEIVSPPMRGDKGEIAIIHLTKMAKKHNLKVNKSCGYHLHLDSRDFARNPREDKEVIDDDKPQANILYHYKLPFNQGKCTTPFLPSDVKTYEVTATPKRVTKTINQGSNFYRLKSLFALYAVFDDVFRAMQPLSRRNNHYCKPTNMLYSYDEIIHTKSYQELEELWYRERKQLEVARRKDGGKYDDTRYTGLNLHVLFSKGHTIEIRYHSPTLNAEKILRWVQIHQAMFSKAVSDISGIKEIIAEQTTIKNKAKTMCSFLELPTDTEQYILARIKKFSEKSEDKEVHN